MDLILSSGYSMPKLSFGTAKIPISSLPEVLVFAVQAGYRHIDTAHIYQNESQIGSVLSSLPIPRSSLFITTKVHPSQYRDVKSACLLSLSNLKVSYIDLLLLHWPFALKPDHESINNKLEKLDRFPLFKVWKQMEELVELGLVRSIGVSNWTVALLVDLLAYSRIPPAVNQIEINPFCNKKKLIEFCKEHKIAVQGYRVIFTPPDGWAGFQGKILEIQEIADMSQKYLKSRAQICINWCLSKGCGVVVKSSDFGRVVENFESQFFEMEKEDLEKIDGVIQEGYFTNVSYSFGLHIFD